MNEPELIQCRENLKQLCLATLKEDSDVKAIFFGGSISRGDEDAYSDIDLRVVLKQEAQSMDKLEQWIQSWEDILFIETIQKSYAVLHFSTFIKVDQFTYYEEDLIPNIWLKDILIVKDMNDSYLSQLKKTSEDINYCLTQSEFDFFLNKYFAYYHELYRRFQRNEWNYALHCSLGMKHCLVSLWYASRGIVPNSLGDWSKYEGSRSHLVESELSFLNTFTPLDITAIPLFAKKITDELFKISQEIAEIKSLNFDQSWFKRTSRLISWSDL